MLSIVSCVFLLLLLLTVGESHVSYKSSFRDIIFPPGPFGIRPAKRSSTAPCRKLCGPSVCGSSGCSGISRRHLLSNNRSNVSDPYGDYANHLRKRVLDGNPGNIGELGKYFGDQGSENGFNNLCPEVNGGTPTFCVEQAFASAPLNSNGQWLAGTGDTELTGCTVLTVVSSRAVYMCHIWESLNFEEQEGSDAPFEGFIPVENLIRGEGLTEYTAGQALDPDLYDEPNDNPWAFISTPRAQADDGTSEVGVLQYQSQIDDLIATLRSLIQNLGVVVYDYELPTVASGRIDEYGNEEYDYEEDYQGVALFEYDSNADAEGNPDWRLWYEAASERGSQLHEAFFPVDP